MGLFVFSLDWKHTLDVQLRKFGEYNYAWEALEVSRVKMSSELFDFCFIGIKIWYLFDRNCQIKSVTSPLLIPFQWTPWSLPVSLITSAPGPV